MASCHVGRCPRFVDEHQPLGIEVEPTIEPRLPAFQDVGAVLLGGMRRVFFARDPVPVEEPPRRADPNRRAAFGQQPLPLDQRDVILRLNRGEDEGCVRVDPGRTTIAALRLSCRRAVLKDQLPPTDRACRADTEPCCCGTA